MNRDTFEYRVVYQEGNGFSIFQLAKNEKGEHHFIGNSPVSPWGCSIKDLQASFERMQEAFEKDVVDYKDIKRY